ncbi:hypothetical protein Y032_0031g2343 [Ancylostoma ceylanicum]|nr:hypothetical protein Y032_0031g2343 [Ancylostoma ceylanicum]
MLGKQSREEGYVPSPIMRHDSNNNLHHHESVVNPSETPRFVDWLSDPRNTDNFSLIDMGRAFLLDGEADSIEYVKECLSPRVVRLGCANVMELKLVHTRCTSPEMRAQIELLAGSELLSLHRRMCHEHLEGDVSGIHRMVRRQHLQPSSFGDADPSIPFCYVGSDVFFKSVNFNEEYAKWKLSVGQHLSEDTKIRHFLKEMLKTVVVDKEDFKKLTVRIRDGNDGLITVPLSFRSSLKGFILHTAGREQDPTFAISLDAMISSMVKEARRSTDRTTRRRCSDAQSRIENNPNEDDLT